MVTVNIDLAGCRILIVGGSSGIGRAVALSTTTAGAEIAIVGRSPEKLAEVIRTAGSGTAIAADVRDPERCIEFVEEAAHALGEFDVVIVASGITCLMPLDRLRAPTLDDLFATNAIAPAHVAAAAGKHLAEHGLMIFLSSISAGGDYKGLGPYAASKSALDRIVRAFRFEHPEHRYICIAVGDTLGTDIARSYENDVVMELLPDWLASGSMYANRMEAGDLGQMLTELIGMLMIHPSITLPQLTVVPEGPMLFGSMDAVTNPEANSG